MNSYKKGYRGETELAAELTRLLGVPVRRTARPYLPGFLAPDCYGIPGVHVESKRRQKLSMAEAIEQARHDAAGNVPVICHRTNRTPWLVTVELADLPRLARIIFDLTHERTN